MSGQHRLNRPEMVLVDLDGTLVDSVPDLADYHPDRVVDSMLQISEHIDW